MQQILLTLLLVFALDPQASATSYTITDLGTLGGSESKAFGINDSGQVVGESYTAGNATLNAFLYSGGQMQDLGIGSAKGINNAGQVVGANGTAFIYSDGVFTTLGTLGGSESAASGINALGQVTGSSHTPGDAGVHAFFYSSGVLTDLGVPFGGFQSSANGINNAGQVVGRLDVGCGKECTESHAVLFSGGAATDLGSLGSPPGSSPFSQANAINNSGQIVGVSKTPIKVDPSGDGDLHAFLYNGTMTDLGVLPGRTNSQAFGINDAGQIVGESDNHAFIFQNNTMSDLNFGEFGAAGWELNSANGINAIGQIVGNGTINGQSHAFLLTPLSSPIVGTVTELGGGGQGGTLIPFTGESPISVAIGTPIHLNDRITTPADGRVQVTLEDGTTFIIGPNSEIVIDEFVYDPSSGLGLLIAKFSKGLFELICSVLSCGHDKKVLTPVDSNAIRGSDVLFNVSVDGAIATDTITVFSGSVEVTNLFSGITTVLNAGDTFTDTAVITPVPEPSTLLLFGSGLAGLAAWRRKRKSKLQ
jgi:probable HAF family extracellular repeat protein